MKRLLTLSLLCQGLVTPDRTSATRITDPSLPSTSSFTSKGRSRTTKDAAWVKSRMRQHNIVSDRREELQKYPNLSLIVDNIVNSDRLSVMKPESAARFLKQHVYYEDQSEETLLLHLVPLILKREHMRKVSHSDQVTLVADTSLRQGSQVTTGDGSAAMDLDEWTSSEWFDDGLCVSKSCDFRRGLLPTNYGDEDFEPEIAKALAKFDGMTNPRPDFCYGLRTDSFPVPSGVMLSSEIQDLLQMAPGMEHPFLTIEGKSNKGVVGEAENQARRGGACLVNGARKLRERVGIGVNDMGPDLKTIVFSATWTPNLVDIFVHWAEVVVGAAIEGTERASTQVLEQNQHSEHIEDIQPAELKSTIFHMTHLKSYPLRNADILPDLRRALHNILTWGCIDRFINLKELRETIYRWQREETCQQQVEAKVRKTRKRQRLEGSSTGAGSR